LRNWTYLRAQGEQRTSSPHSVDTNRKYFVILSMTQRISVNTDARSSNNYLTFRTRLMLPSITGLANSIKQNHG
jgi:hypothetical protein